MPCQDEGQGRWEWNRLQARHEEVTQMLCGVCRILEADGQLMRLPAPTRVWWMEHQAQDRLRQAEEKEQDRMKVARAQEELRTPNTVEHIVRMIGGLGPRDQVALFLDRLPAAFCMACGSKRSRESPKCYCEADE